MLDVGFAAVFLAGLHDFRVLQVLRGDLFHPRGCRRGEERGLPAARCRADDALDVRREPAVEHLVGLIQHQHVKVSEPKRAPFDVVEHSAGRSDDHLGPARKRLLL